MSSWRKLVDLSWSDRLLLLRAAVLLIQTRLLLPAIDYRVDPSATDARHAARPRPIDLPRAQAIARLVNIASAHTPVAFTCLHRSTVLWELLRRHGIACQLRLGASSDGGNFAAHAWVECAGVALHEGTESLSSFRPFARAVMPIQRRARWRLET